MIRKRRTRSDSPGTAAIAAIKIPATSIAYKTYNRISSVLSLYFSNRGLGLKAPRKYSFSAFFWRLCRQKKAEKAKVLFTLPATRRQANRVRLVLPCLPASSQRLGSHLLWLLALLRIPHPERFFVGFCFPRRNPLHQCQAGFRLAHRVADSFNSKVCNTIVEKSCH